MSEGLTLIDFYDLCASFFESIINSGYLIWRYISTPIGDINDDLPESWATAIGDWLVGPIADYNILELGMGFGLNVFLIVCLIKFFKVI